MRDKIADTTGSLKEQAKRTYLALQKAQKEEADANNLKRHLKEQLEIISAEAKEKQEVAMKADAIAKKMEEMAAKADGAYEEVQATEEKTAAGYASAKSDYDARTEAESVAEKLRREAEDKAQAASSKLEEADKQVRELLQVIHECLSCFVCLSSASPAPPPLATTLGMCFTFLDDDGCWCCVRFVSGRSTKGWRT